MFKTLVWNSLSKTGLGESLETQLRRRSSKHLPWETPEASIKLQINHNSNNGKYWNPQSDL